MFTRRRRRPQATPAKAVAPVHGGPRPARPAARPPAPRLISWPALAMLTVGSVGYLGSAPALAVFGLASVFLYVLPAFVFLVPVSLVAAELAGVEVNAVHVDELRNPRREYPKSIFLAMALVLAVFIGPTLAISWVIPAARISFTTGVMQAFDSLFTHFGAGFAVPLIAIALAVGALAGMISWLDGPSEGLLRIGREQGFLPPYFQKVNDQGIEVRILAAQGTVITLIAVLSRKTASRHNDHREAGLPGKGDRHTERQPTVTTHDDHNRPGRSTLAGDRSGGLGEFFSHRSARAAEPPRLLLRLQHRANLIVQVGRRRPETVHHVGGGFGRIVIATLGRLHVDNLDPSLAISENTPSSC